MALALWFEVAELKRSGVMSYAGTSLELAHKLQGAIPREELFSRTVDDGLDAVEVLTDAVRKLAEFVESVDVLAPPAILWRADETGELF